MRTHAIREKFLDFFERQGHRRVASDSLVPGGDPTLLFTSAGMVQFKKHFLGETRLEFRRAASSQKCLRTSDIDRVGLTARHLTFFEMLGNFSFGDYFKAEAVAWAWEFLSKEIGLDPKLLYPSIYEEDDEARDLWKKFVPESKIVRLGKDSNFWTMGPTGPCGPCSEILFDRGPQFSQGHPCPGPGCDCDRYMEIWNLVFTQFDRKADGKLEPLPQKNIDTGMGLERLSVVANGLSSSFDIDLFQSVIAEVRGVLGPDCSLKTQRIVSDHVRSCAFLIGDGILPSNEGRGYVLRRLLRRALRAGWMEGRKEPFLYRIARVVAEDMEPAYPELRQRLENIQSILRTEEKNALETIETGTKTLEAEIKRALGGTDVRAPLGPVRLPGEKVFQIYDTYGLDRDIQKEIVADWGGELIFDTKDYDQARAKAVESARKGWKGSGEKDVSAYSRVYKHSGASSFKGYEALALDTHVAALLKEKRDSGGKPALEAVQELAAGEAGEIVLQETPFYAESGGQVGDKGALNSSSGSKRNFDIEVLDTQKPYEGLIVHAARVRAGTIRVGEAVTARVDEALRRHTMRHHTATHLLHAALRRALGAQVTQAGSLVSPEKLRFDFTYPRALSDVELARVQADVNRAVLADVGRERAEKTLEEARALGALAFFGDKYGARVYVVQYGPLSTEVCGGTHCRATGEVGAFKILSESSVGSGVRRIEAVAGEKALDYLAGRESLLRMIAERLKCSQEESPEKVEKVLERQAELEREIGKMKKKSSLDDLSGLAARARGFALAAGSVKILAEEASAADPSALRDSADHLRDRLGSGIVLLAGAAGDKVSFVVTLTADCRALGFDAGKIARAFAARIGGSGGGKDLFAQGGGKKTSDLKAILASFPDEIVKMPAK